MPAINRDMASAMMERPTPGASTNPMIQAHHARREINQAVRKSSNESTQMAAALRDGNKPVVSLLRSGNNVIANLLKTEIANTQDQVKLTESLLQHQIRTYQKPSPTLLNIYRKSQDLSQSLVSNTGLLVRKFHDTMIVKHRLERKQDVDYLENQKFRDKTRNDLLLKISSILDPRKQGIFTRIFDGMKMVGGAIVGGSALLVGKMVKSVLNGQAFKVAGSIMKGMGGFFDDVVKYVGKPLGITNAAGSKISFTKLSKRLPILGLIVGSMMSINDALAGFDNADKLLNIKPADLKFSDKIIAGAAMFFNKLSGGLTEKIAQYFGYASSPVALKAAYDKVIDFSKPYYDKFIQPILNWMDESYNIMLQFTGAELEKLKQEGVVAYTKEALPRLKGWVIAQATMLKDWSLAQFNYISDTISGYFKTEDKSRYLSLTEITTKMKTDLKDIGSQVSNYILQTIIGYQGQVSDLFLVQDADGTTRPMNWKDVKDEVIKLGDTVYTSLKNFVINRVDTISTSLLNSDMFSQALDADGNERDWLPLTTIGANIGKWLVKQIMQLGSDFGKMIEEDPKKLREAVISGIHSGRDMLQGFIHSGIDVVFGTIGGALKELFSSPEIKDTSIMTPDQLRAYLDQQKAESEKIIGPILKSIFGAMIGLTVDTGKYLIGKIWDSLTSAEFLGMAVRGVDSVLQAINPATQTAVVAAAITPAVMSVFNFLASGVGSMFQQAIFEIDWRVFQATSGPGPLQRVVDFVGRFSRAVWNLDKYFLEFSKEAAPLTKGLRTFENGRAISQMVDALGNVSQIYNRVESTFFITKKVADFFEGIGNAIGTVKGIVPFMGRALSLVGKIAWPLQIITSVFDFLSGITDTVTADRLGFDPSKVNFGDKMSSGVGSVIKGIVDLPMSLINWLGRSLISDNFSIGEGEDVAKYVTTQLSKYIRVITLQGSVGDVLTNLFDITLKIPMNIASFLADRLFGAKLPDGEDMSAALHKWIDDKLGKMSVGETIFDGIMKGIGWIGKKLANLFGAESMSQLVDDMLRKVPGGDYILDWMKRRDTRKKMEGIASEVRSGKIDFNNLQSEKYANLSAEERDALSALLKDRAESIVGFGILDPNKEGQAELERIKKFQSMSQEYTQKNNLATVPQPPPPPTPDQFQFGEMGMINAQAKGGAWVDGRIVPFALGGVPDVISNPTYFPMANGNTGLMGEAGPEAIMPLQRDKQGRLGVHGMLPSVQFPDHLTLDSTQIEMTKEAATRIGESINKGLQPFIKTANELLEKANPVFDRNTDELKKLMEHLVKVFTPDDNTLSRVGTAVSNHYQHAVNSLPSSDAVKQQAKAAAQNVSGQLEQVEEFVRKQGQLYIKKGQELIPVANDYIEKGKSQAAKVQQQVQETLENQMSDPASPGFLERVKNAANKVIGNVSDGVSSGVQSVKNGVNAGVETVGNLVQSKGGIDAYMAKTARAESGGNNSLVSDTGATGKYQFTIGTWNGIAEKYPDRVKAYGGKVATITKANKGTANDPRRDVKSQEAYMRILTEDNAKAIGTDDPGALYLAHFMGADGAKALMSAVSSGQGNIPALNLMSDKLRSQMMGSRTNMTVVGGKTAKQVVDWAYQKMDSSSANMSFSGGAANVSNALNAKADELYADGRITHAGLAKMLNITGASADVLMGVINSKDGYLPSASKEQVMAGGTGVGVGDDIANLNIPGVTHVGRMAINDNSRPNIRWNGERVGVVPPPNAGTQTVPRMPPIPVPQPSTGTQTVPTMPAIPTPEPSPQSSAQPSSQSLFGRLSDGLKSSAVSVKNTATSMLGASVEWLKGKQNIFTPQAAPNSGPQAKIEALKEKKGQLQAQMDAYAKAAGFSSYDEYKVKQEEVLKTLPANSSIEDIAKAMGYDQSKAVAALKAAGKPQSQAQLGTTTQVKMPSESMHPQQTGPLPEGTTIRPNFLNTGMKSDVINPDGLQTGAIRNGGFNGPVNIQQEIPSAGAIRNGGFDGPVSINSGTSTLQVPNVVRKPMGTGQMGIANGDIPAPAAKTSFADTPNNFMMQTLSAKLMEMQEAMARQAESALKANTSAPQQPNVNNTPHIDSIPVTIDDMGLVMINSYVM